MASRRVQDSLVAGGDAISGSGVWSGEVPRSICTELTCQDREGLAAGQLATERAGIASCQLHCRRLSDHFLRYPPDDKPTFRR